MTKDILNNMTDDQLNEVIRQAALDTCQHKAIIARNEQISAMARMRLIQKQIDNSEVE